MYGNHLVQHLFSVSHLLGKALFVIVYHWLPTISPSIISIQVNVFNCCKALTSTSFPSNIKSIGENALYKCDVLTSISLPPTIEFIGCRTFVGYILVICIYLSLVSRYTTHKYLTMVGRENLIFLVFVGTLFCG